MGSKIVLTARHGNGWDTHVVQTAEGKFAAWAAPRGIRGMSEYVDLDETAAKQAALSSLERRTGHTQCTTECSPWEPAEIEEDGAASLTRSSGTRRLNRRLAIAESSPEIVGRGRLTTLPPRDPHELRLPVCGALFFGFPDP